MSGADAGRDAGATRCSNLADAAYAIRARERVRPGRGEGRGPARRGAGEQGGLRARRDWATFLTRLADRNKDLKEPSGLFASHPDTQASARPISAEQGARREADGVGDGCAALHAERSRTSRPPSTASRGAASRAAKPASSGGSKFGLSGLPRVGNEKSSNQTVSSAGSRGVNPDRDAKGGPNKTSSS